MQLKDGIQMIIGCNFIRAMKGGVRIEGNMVTFYKNLTTLETQPEVSFIAKSIPELDMDYDELQLVQETVYFNMGVGSQNFKSKFSPLLERLQQKGYIGEDPLRHWKNNRVLCQLEIINPDVCIQDTPLKQVTPAMEKSFAKHIDALLQIGVIRKSNSRHRTMAMMVNSGTSIDPETGKEVKGKERIVFNYRTLNDNTHKDQYSLPGINTIIKKIGNSQIYSKFDLKSGFHHVAMV